MRARRWCLALVPAILALASCSQGVETHPSPPVTGQYQLAFSSTEDAVLTDQVEILVFDADATDADCLSLLVARKAKAALPDAPALLEDTGSVATCDLTTRTLDVGFGHRSLLAVATRAGADFLTGCAQADLEAGSGVLTIYLARVDLTDPPPATTCTSLSQKCAGGC